MATLESGDRNIVDADAINWRLVVYPLLLVVVVLVGGFGAYYYHLNERETEETQARDALAQAKSPAEMAKVADQYPQTTQAAVALISAADASYTARDYAGAMKDYQRVASAKETPVELRDSAQIGLASSQVAAGKPDDAIHTYLEVAQKGVRSAFAPAAYYGVAQIYADRKDSANEKTILQRAVQLGGDSPFVKEAAAQLKALGGAPPAETPSAPATNAPAATPKAP